MFASRLKQWLLAERIEQPQSSYEPGARKVSSLKASLSGKER